MYITLNKNMFSIKDMWTLEIMHIPCTTCPELNFICKFIVNSDSITKSLHLNHSQWTVTSSVRLEFFEFPQFVKYIPDVWNSQQLSILNFT